MKSITKLIAFSLLMLSCKKEITPELASSDPFAKFAKIASSDILGGLATGYTVGKLTAFNPWAVGISGLIGGGLSSWANSGIDLSPGDNYPNFEKSLNDFSGARTCDHLIMSQVSNTYNSHSSNHTVNISKIKGYELSATIPAIAQGVYGKYRT
jgi:hypothetical protein